LGVHATAAEQVARVKSRVDEMECKLSGLLAKNKEWAIQFAGLGFQTISDSNAWLEMAVRIHQPGLIVDLHMVFEHVYHAIEGIDTIATMEKLYNIKFLCITVFFAKDNVSEVSIKQERMPLVFSGVFAAPLLTK
jgi:hypothetical protein